MSRAPARFDAPAFRHPPQKTFWGFGAELADRDGYLVRLWDERSMKSEG